MSVRLISGFKMTANVTDQVPVFTQPQSIQTPSTASLPVPTSERRPSVFADAASALKTFAVSIGHLSPPRDVVNSGRKYALWGSK